MWKKKCVAVAVLVGVLTVSGVNVLANPAPDGKTMAVNTLAAGNGNYEKWEEEWREISTDWTQVAITPGADETKMNFAWYSENGERMEFRYGRYPDLSDGGGVLMVHTDAQEGYQANRVTLEGLEANTTYYYQITGKEIQKFETKDSERFQFVFVGDPQIGSSNEEKAKKPEDIQKESFKTAQYEAVENDSFNWENTLERAIEKIGGMPSFVLSAGDQIQTNAKKVQDTTISEIEYAGYLSPDVLRGLPVATTVGNHDADNVNYNHHFNIPNLSELGSNGVVGGDYYFRYGNVLFIVLNTQDTNVAEHSNEPEITNLRYELVPILEENKIDVVLTGHDHAYSRSYLLEGGRKTNDYTEDEFELALEKDLDNGESGASLTVAPKNIKMETAQKEEKNYLDYLNLVMDKEAVVSALQGKTVVENPKGIVYLTAGSSSGSKYYDLVPRKQSYIASRWQEDVPTYSIIEVTDTTFTINSYRTDTNEKIDTSFTIIKK